MKLRTLLFISLVITSLLPFTALADWINLTGAETSPNLAEIYVVDDHVRVVLEAYVDDLDVYDKLAISVQGDLLTDIYLQNRKSFAVKKAGGAQARVNEVDVLAATAGPVADQSGSFILDASWTAQGSVGHWGHVHTRKNYYDAAITIAVVDGAWKITAMDLLEERRVEPGMPVKRVEK